MIFGLVTLGVLSTFRTATRAHERSGRMMVTLQTSRAVQDTLARDIRAVFLVNETNYGVQLPEVERDSGLSTTATTTQDTLTARQGLVDYTVGQSSDLLTEEDYTDSSLAADLYFTVTDGGETDSISFVRRMRSIESRRAQPWALACLTYSVKGEELVRSVAPVYGAQRPLEVLEGETVEEARDRQREETVREEPKEETLADGVEVFDVRCVYWESDEWVAAEEWDSSGRDHRNALGAYALDITDPNYSQVSALIDAMPEDGLPAALEITLGLRDPIGSRVRISRLLVPVQAAQETWSPPDESLVEALERSSRRTGEGR
jgi:hypothetical protein